MKSLGTEKEKTRLLEHLGLRVRIIVSGDGLKFSCQKMSQKSEKYVYSY